MSINAHFDSSIAVQTGTATFGGAMSYSTVGTNRGYIRALGASERVSVDKPTLFATHRAVMDMTVTPVYGQFLLLGSVRYKVKLVDPHGLSGGAFQTADCEVIT